jgi:hypothetical protein
MRATTPQKKTRSCGSHMKFLLPAELGEYESNQIDLSATHSQPDSEPDVSHGALITHPTAAGLRSSIHP